MHGQLRLRVERQCLGQPRAGHVRCHLCMIAMSHGGGNWLQHTGWAAHGALPRVMHVPEGVLQTPLGGTAAVINTMWLDASLFHTTCNFGFVKLVVLHCAMLLARSTTPHHPSTPMLVKQPTHRKNIIQHALGTVIAFADATTVTTITKSNSGRCDVTGRASHEQRRGYPRRPGACQLIQCTATPPIGTRASCWYSAAAVSP